MIIRNTDDYSLDVKVTWLSPEQLQLKFTTRIDGDDARHREYYLTPAELILLSDHINDVLCR
jgi:hypothetical protein